MAKPSYRSVIPTPILIGAGLMIAMTMTFAFVSKRLPAGTERPVWAPTSTLAEVTLESLDLRFEDQADGSVDVIDVGQDRTIATFEPGSNGFARIVLRGMVKERLSMGGDRSKAFRLRRSEDGSLALGDLATGREIHLAAFGEASIQAFEQLMAAGVSDR